MATYAVIVHGGAGRFRDDRIEPVRTGLAHALYTAREVLRRGRSAVDAVEAAVRALENDPTFNAGRGAHPNAAGVAEMDALIADGNGPALGAVAAIRNVRHPISVARRVMEKTPHCMLVGEGATRFAKDEGFQYAPDSALIAAEAGPDAQDTVGAVALDATGAIAAATSTGGTRGKMPGRVGDSPLFGAGAYALNSEGGASATGHGESLIKVLMAKTTVDAIAQGMAPMDAARHAVEMLESRTGGKGGVICLAPDGRVGFQYNTPHLAVGHDAGDGNDVIQV